jgi:hypothetical protein
MLKPIATTPAGTKVYVPQLLQGSRDYYGEIETTGEQPGSFTVVPADPGPSALVGVGTNFLLLTTGQKIQYTEIPGAPPATTGIVTVNVVTDATHMTILEDLTGVRESTFIATAYQEYLMLVPINDGRGTLTVRPGDSVAAGASVYITNAPHEDVKNGGGDFFLVHAAGASIWPYEFSSPITAFKFVNDAEDFDNRRFSLRFRPVVH